MSGLRVIHCITGVNDGETSLVMRLFGCLSRGYGGRAIVYQMATSAKIDERGATNQRDDAPGDRSVGKTILMLYMITKLGSR